MRNNVFNGIEPNTLKPASVGSSMHQFIEWTKTYSSLKPKNIFEIGANMAQDAEALREGFGVKPADVWTFEPHPLLSRYIDEHYEFKNYEVAVSDTTGSIKINAIDPRKSDNSGISSARKHLHVDDDNFISVDVPCVRMDDFIREHEIDSIDFLKLDVEGLNYEVLQGFADQIVKIQAIHIEAEHKESWEGERLWNDIRTLLEPHFELVYFQRYFTQSDSFWIKGKYLIDNGHASDSE